LPILFEDEALLVVNKPAGIAVHGGSGVSFGVIEALRRQRPQARFLELAHRLDRETSGILLVGKSVQRLSRFTIIPRRRHRREGDGSSTQCQVAAAQILAGIGRAPGTRCG
jgi:23S rRNA-/tRNA-specific pseudouridylate synthase